MIDLTGNIWQRWQRKHDELTREGKWNLAGLFRGHLGDHFHSPGKTVLLTGKATAGEFSWESSEELFFGNNKGAFWAFARRLNRLAGGSQSPKPDRLGWSNLFKIGVTKGNPRDALVNVQWDLAVETLRQEWYELKPTLVVCVTESYYERVIYDALNVKQGPEDGFQETKRANGTFWLRPARDGMPALLWMKHPQGKTARYLEQAEELAEQLLDGKLPSAAL